MSHLEHPKVEHHHLQKLAIVYVRQSTMHQVQHHTESTKVQYSLAAKAEELGWPSERVLVIDSDLGVSGATAEDRPGFQRLLSELALNHVGIVLGAEMSRLARSCKDWYHLLELCAVFKVLICDVDGVYDPANYNDRLLLGLKGTMSEAELHILKQRMWQGTMQKAQRGELVTQVPIGYVRTASGEVALDPDEEAQSIVRSVFRTFERLGTLQATLREFRRQGVLIPVRCNSGDAKGQLEWRKPNQTTLRNVLKHPIYAGAYAYGRSCQNPKTRMREGKRRILRRDQWRVLLRDCYPAYISWEQYERNLAQLENNRSRADRLGSARSGRALCAGLVICARCGYRMFTRYSGKANQPRYQCSAQRIVHGEQTCQGFTACVLDEEVSRLVLLALTPSALEISLRVAADLRTRREESERQWQLRMERAQYEADRARRQYEAVEPENRLVARTLEAAWESRLRNHRQLVEEYDRHRQDLPAALSAEQEERIQRLASNLPSIWNASTTTDADRKEIIRQLVEQVVVNVEGETEWVEARIRWTGGNETYTRFRRPVARVDQLSNWESLQHRIRELLRRQCRLSEVVDTLNREGYRSASGRSFTQGSLGTVMLRYELRPDHPTASETGGQQTNWTIVALCRELQVGYQTVYQWITSGKLQAQKIKGRWIITADSQARKLLVGFKELQRERKAHHQSASNALKP